MNDAIQAIQTLFGVGAQLREAWSAYQGIARATDAAQFTSGDVELEITDGQVRFKVGGDVCRQGLTFTEAVTEFVRRSGIINPTAVIEAMGKRGW